MKLILTLWLALTVCAAHAAPSTFGTHGMVLFGGADGLYASHLPMYHAPHDYQVVLRLRMADAAQDAQLRARLQERVALWTLDPQKFAIDRLAPDAATALNTFKAGVVLGHFEQDGVTQHAAADFVIEEVLHYRQLPMQPGVASKANYLQFGKAQRRYLVKLIESRPDFDHIFIVDSRPGQGKMLGTVYYNTDDLR